MGGLSVTVPTTGSNLPVLGLRLRSANRAVGITPGSGIPSAKMSPAANAPAKLKDDKMLIFPGGRKGMSFQSREASFYCIDSIAQHCEF